jgi:tetratricopeptide (TPR) repeat protein
MKANFFYQSLEKELEELQNLIDEITKLHIVSRAEGFWDQGSENIALSQFNKALRYFAIASKYYARASEICENYMEQRLYLALSKITLASRFEAEANELYKRQDNPEQASKHFHKAVEIVDIALGFLATIKNETLINNMTAQRSFYEGLSFETEGIFFFDQEKFNEALAKFELAMKKFDETQQKASEGGLEQLLEFVRLARSEVDGYISMAKTMM